jgi:ABC-type multidrug transport system fused ATPase/permease subunit
MRQYDPISGTIKIDNQALPSVTLNSLRQQLAFVPQDTALFNNTVAYNIRYGKPNASDAEIERAAKQAQIHDSILRTSPLAYSAHVGERGLKLSGGERQRLTLARALIREPRLLLIDEGTSALDSSTEELILRSVSEYLVADTFPRSAVFIAHRLATISECDRIFVMKDGRIVEAGTHDELLQNNDGLYRYMWMIQQTSD